MNSLKVEVEQFVAKYCNVMKENDVMALDEILLDDVILSHIAGYIQPKEEWLAQVVVDYFNYNDIIASNVKYAVKEN